MDIVRKLALAAFAVLAPIHAVMVVTGILIVLDTITGIWAALKTGQTFNSAALRRSVSKALVYQIAIISAFMVEKWLLADILPASKLVAGLIGVVELTSILENLNKIYGTDIFKSIIAKLGSVNDNKPK
jgi:phage-related holin